MARSAWDGATPKEPSLRDALADISQQHLTSLTRSPEFTTKNGDRDAAVNGFLGKLKRS